MKLVAHEFVSIDGVAQAPGGPDEDRSGGFAYGGWLTPYFSDEGGAILDEAMGRLDALLLGRMTYEIFASFWPQVGDADAVGERFNRVPKYLVSSTITDPVWAGTSVVDVAAIRALKEQPGQEIQIHGSLTLVRTLLDEGLLDELRIFQAPVVLGQGKRLFALEARPTAYEVLEHRSLPHGVSYLVLAPRGRPETADITAG